MKRNAPLLPLIVALFVCLRAPAEVNAPAATNAPPDPYALLAQFDFGRDRAALNQIDAAIREAGVDAGKQAAIEQKLLAVLSQPGLTPGAQDYICRSLSIIGTGHCVPALAGLLSDERGADQARIALERIPHPAAGEALRAALSKSTGRVRLGVIHSLGVRRDAASVPQLLPLLKDSDAPTAAAAAGSLGRIGGDEALEGLMKCGRMERPEVADAVLMCADQLGSREAKHAGGVYRAVLSACPVSAIQEAGLVGLARVRPDDAGERLLAMFESGDAAAMNRAIRLARRVNVPSFAKAATDRLPKLPPDSQIAVLALLADSGDAVSRPAALKLVSSGEESVRLAALDTLGSLPAAKESLAALARAASSGPMAERKAAARNLARIKGDGVDALFLRAAAAGSADERIAFIAALGDRQTPGADAALMSMQKDGAAEVRRAALKALDKVAPPEAHAAIVSWMLAARDEQEMREAERLAIRLGAKAPRAVEDLIAADAQATDEGRERLARCLARRGGDVALRQVRAYRASGRSALELAAVRALGTWIDGAPLSDLQQIVEKGGDARLVAVAVQGIVQLLGVDQGRAPEAKAGLIAQLLNSVQVPDARKQLIGALGDYACTSAVATATGLINDPQIAAEAKATLRRLRQASLGAPGLTASHGASELPKAVDGNPGTRWSTGTGMSPGQWLELDLHAACLVRRVVLDTTGSPGDYPRNYQVFVGDAPAPSGTPALTGEGNGPVTDIVLDPPRRGRYVRIVQTGSVGNLYWSVHELKVEAELAEESAP